MSVEPAEPLLSPSQRRVVGFALTVFAALGAVALLIGVLIVLGRAISFFSNVLWPLAVAAVLALILRPLVEVLERRLRRRRLAAVILLYGFALLALAGLLLAVVPPLVEQAIAFVAYLPTLWDNTVNYVRQHFPEWMDFIQRQLAKLPGAAAAEGQRPPLANLSATLIAQIEGLLRQAVPSLVAAGGGVVGVFVFFANLAIIPVYLFFFLLARGEPTHRLPEHLVFLRPSMRENVVFLIREFLSIVVAFFRGQLLIGLIMGALLATGFSLIGLRFGLIIGLTLGLLNIVPYLGSITGLAITLPLAFFQQPDGGWQMIALVLLVVVIVQLIEGWVLTPKIMGMQTGLHPAAIIVAVFFWGTAFSGVLGMLLAVPLTAFFVTAWRLIRLKYFDGPAPASTE